jgi:PAS domain S-box-containing protein
MDNGEAPDPGKPVGRTELDLALRRLPDAVIELDGNGRVTGWLGAAARLLGWSAEEAVGRDVQTLLRPRDALGNRVELGACESARVLHTITGTPEQEVLVECRHRQELWLGVSCSFERAAGGRITRVVAVGRDITRRKRIDLPKSEVLSAVSHELRSPLSSIKGFTSTLLSHWERFNDEAKRDLLTAVESDADRVTRLINELLDIARIEAGTLVVHPYIIDLRDLAAKVVARLAHRTEAHTLLVDFPPTFPPAHADPDKIEQVLTNLVENAVRHTPAGTITVAGETGDQQVRISVSDEGEGIPPEQRAKVFGKFYRREQQAGSPSGTGLGLYISKRLVEAHHGRIWVEGRPGGGAVFAFTLPLVDLEPLAGRD